MLLSLISPDNNNNNTTNNNNKKLLDNYDIQQMDIVDDLPPPPPPLPPNHLPFFDPLPPLPPPPPSLFDIFPVNQSFPVTNWPRPNFVQQPSIPESWPQSFNNPTDIDLRRQPMNNHHNLHHIIPQINEPLPNKTSQQQQRRKRSKKFSKKHHHERESKSSMIIPSTTDHVDKLLEQSPSLTNNNNAADDDEDERLLREELLRTLSSKRKDKIIKPTNSEPNRIVTIVSSISPPPPPVVNPTPVLVNKPIETSTKSQYSINQRYKRVKANVSLTNVTNKIETTAAVVRTAQPVFQTRNKIVRAVSIFMSFLFDNLQIILN